MLVCEAVLELVHMTVRGAWRLSGLDHAVLDEEHAFVFLDLVLGDLDAVEGFGDVFGLVDL